MKQARTEGLQELPVMVLMENKKNRIAMKQQLKDWNLRVLAVDRGETALQALSRLQEMKQQVELVITDEYFAGIEGRTFIQKLQRMNLRPNSIIMTSPSSHLLHNIVRCRQLGVGAYIQEPICPSDLLDKILSTVSWGKPQKTLPSSKPIKDKRWKDDPYPSVTEILKRLGSDQEMLNVMTSMFTSHCSDWIAALKDARKEVDIKKMQGIAKTIQDSLSYFGAYKALHIVKDLYRLAQMNRFVRMDQTILRLEQEMTQLQSVLSQVLHIVNQTYKPHTRSA